MNINYIRAAIQANTGIKLTLRQTAAYLLEEKLVTKAQFNRLLFPGYEILFPSSSDNAKRPDPIHEMVLPVDLVLNTTTGS